MRNVLYILICEEWVGQNSFSIHRLGPLIDHESIDYTNQTNSSKPVQSDLVMIVKEYKLLLPVGLYILFI